MMLLGGGEVQLVEERVPFELAKSASRSGKLKLARQPIDRALTFTPKDTTYLELKALIDSASADH